MNLDEYQQLAVRTAKRVDRKYDLTHAALGLSGEAGEFGDAIKKSVIYNKPLDEWNAIEELGDILWYVALASATLDVSMAEIAKMNIDKLRLRYPDQYTDTLAQKRLDKAGVLT